ncbi:hypothetical protein L6V77_33570 [Myxococcota bacterium]|nr:hypothetical protein [Myxococcota bacterium]
MKSLQLYLVLTPDASAAQGPDAFTGIDAAVNGQGERYGAVRHKVRIMPNGYKVDFTLDFAHLFPPACSPEPLAPMMKGFSDEGRTLAQTTKLGVVVRGDATLPPQREHPRLTGVVPHAIADRRDGVIVDFIARRAYTKDQSFGALGDAMGPEAQVCVVTKNDEGGKKWLLTRGNPKFGLPDLEIRCVAEADLERDRTRLNLAQRRLHVEGPAGAPPELCTGPKGTYDGGLPPGGVRVRLAAWPMATR